MFLGGIYGGVESVRLGTGVVDLPGAATDYLDGISDVFPAGSENSGPAYAVVLDGDGNVYVAGVGIGITESITNPGNHAVNVVKIAQQVGQVQPGGLTAANGASFHPGLPAPGGLASLFLHGLTVAGTVTGTGSPLPTELEGVSVFVDGLPAPLLAVANVPVENPVGLEQINFQVPFEARSNLVELRYQGLSTNPAAPGETIVIYSTGLGPVTQSCQTSNVMFGGTPGNGDSVAGVVSYAGLTPGAIGLYQLNVAVPPATPSGAVNVYLFSPWCWWMDSPPPNTAYSNVVELPVH